MSFRDLQPLEDGGRTARDGFEFQDWVGVIECLTMLDESSGSIEVWSESEDDLVVVWSEKRGGRTTEVFELVQVKGNELNQAWTVAKLCEFDIVEKSLAHDRADDECRFRLVTRWPPKESLRKALGPKARGEEAKAVRAELRKNVKTRSTNGHDAGFWADRTTWAEYRDYQVLRDRAEVLLNGWLQSKSEYLARDQIGELNARILRLVQDAALAHPEKEREKKRITREHFVDWLLRQVHELANPGAAGRSPLEVKLNSAGESGDPVESAKELRRKYLKRMRDSSYLETQDLERIPDEVQALLLRLMNDYDRGAFQGTPADFKSRCLAEIGELMTELSRSGLPTTIPLGYGCMYDLMHRCVHRLTRERA